MREHRRFCHLHQKICSRGGKSSRAFSIQCSPASMMISLKNPKNVFFEIRRANCITKFDSPSNFRFDRSWIMHSRLSWIDFGNAGAFHRSGIDCWCKKGVNFGVRLNLGVAFILRPRKHWVAFRKWFSMVSRHILNIYRKGSIFTFGRL